ncbi:MAG: SpoIIE family protein phosphatase [Xenococcaceae cyanobacterium MO_188.B19]|nr:SpoIIE family protein phosphatase [Xenococcaceae cyanobacterium MO_188.B19]
MYQTLEAMTVVPFPHNPSDNNHKSNSVRREPVAPVVALKELVANLQREQNKIQDLLSSLGFALRSFSNLNQFLELTPLMAARVTDAVGGVLMLYKEDGHIGIEQFHCQDSQLGKQVRQVFENVSVSVSSTQLLEEKLKQELSGQVAIYGTPVLVRNMEQGRLFVFSTDLDYLWTTTRRKLVQLVADQTAVAIANHELTVELRSKERQDRELEIASEIQVRLLPSKCPQIKGLEIAAACKTANRVGGDYYDFIPTNYDRLHQGNNDSASPVPWSIVIGDVMGKGVPAGLIMTMTRGMLRAEVLNRHSPAQIMEHLNRVMYADLENSHRFVSMFYSEYDPNTRQLSFTNAAHNPPLWWHAEDGNLSKLDTWGMLIGLDVESEYEDGLVQLAPGDTVMYYTDGFTDAVNGNGDRFDEDNLCQAFEWACQNLANPQEILDYLFEEIEKFVGQPGINNKDDMTLIVMRVGEQELT